jgi:transcriptional regulator with XRE-family HTH domain
MASSDSPAGARRRVRLAVREAREACAFTQSQVAEAMEWSLSKVMRIESGEVTISPNDLRPLLAYLGVTHREQVDRLVQDARTSRRRQMWWDEPRQREHLTQAMRQQIQYEAEAVEARMFFNMLIPGRLQTRAYATAILEAWRGHLDEAAVAARVDARMRRRMEFLTDRNPADTYLLLAESATRQRIGDARITGEQLLDLLGLARDGRLRLRILPFETYGPLTVLGPFEVLNLPGDGDNVVLYRESILLDEIVEDQTKVLRHRDIFDEQWNAALDEASSALLLEESAKRLLEDAAVPVDDYTPPRRRRKTSG